MCIKYSLSYKKYFEISMFEISDVECIIIICLRDTRKIIQHLKKLDENP